MSVRFSERKGGQAENPIGLALAIILRPGSNLRATSITRGLQGCQIRLARSLPIRNTVTSSFFFFFTEEEPIIARSRAGDIRDGRVMTCGTRGFFVCV